jgi:CheY-like chemotaxis protein
MPEETFSIEVDNILMEKLFALADMQAPSPVNKADLQTAVSKIKEKMSSLALNMSSMSMNSVAPNAMQTGKSLSASNFPAGNSNRLRTALVVDDLGVITYQLQSILKKIGFEVVISNEINDAIEKYKKQDFGYAVIDLFIPTDREGFMLLDELKKLSLLCQLNTKIIVMTASSKEEYKINCINRGADSYIEKATGWQKELLQACLD